MISLRLFFILFSFFIMSCQQMNTDKLDLKTMIWTLHSMSDSLIIDSVSPGDVHLALMSKGIIPDPFFRDNENKVQWVGESDWIFKTSFDVPATMLGHDEVNLVFEGLDTYAEVWINDSLVLKSDNMFRRWEIPVKAILQKNNNLLQVRFSSPVPINQTKATQYGVPLPEIRAFTRKAPYQFGWDWGPKLVTMGIWRPLYLEAWSEAKLKEVFIDQHTVTDSVAQIMVNVLIESVQSCKTTLTLLVSEEMKTNIRVDLHSGINRFSLPITLFDPTLWYPNGMGNADLTNFRVIMNQEGRETSISVNGGLRKIELIQEPDESGQRFLFKVNNQPVYIKGANIIPQDNFLTRVTRARTRELLIMAYQSNINMLRVWGGGVYETDDFYELCDSLGIMVWQDFMFAGTVYPGDSAFIENVTQEVKEQVIRLRNHPCMALWCGNNEIDEAWHNWGWQKSLGYSVMDSTKLWNDYLHLFEEIIPRVVKEHDPQTDYVPSSPANGWGREKAYQQGDVHYWGVWWGDMPFEEYNVKIGRFVSEYGFQGMPDPKTIDSFTMPGDRNLDSEVMAAHQKHSRGKELIREYMERDFKVPEDFEDYIYVSQLLQARGIKKAIEAHRRARPYNMGTMYWQLNDCWPVTSWSGIDYNHHWKTMQFAVKRAYDRFLVSFVENNDSLAIWVVSDCFIDRNTELRWQLMTFDGDTLKTGSTGFALPAGSSVVAAQMSLRDFEKFKHKMQQVVLKAGVWDKSDLLVDALYYFGKPKELILPENSGIQLSAEPVSDGYLLTISAEKMARNVWIQTDMEGNFSNNFFDVLPGEWVQVLFSSSRQGLVKEDFRFRSLGELN
ncbi:MAG: hypothetical protein A2W85_00815 [Bacteroidetes bacterium GWF2_41_31]|nr:MAG: hypothetical protein A2W85_00815 [Bacteroidetes bacterium GWF2_41_31]